MACQPRDRIGAVVPRLAGPFALRVGVRASGGAPGAGGRAVPLRRCVWAVGARRAVDLCRAARCRAGLPLAARRARSLHRRLLETARRAVHARLAGLRRDAARFALLRWLGPTRAERPQLARAAVGPDLQRRADRVVPARGARRAVASGCAAQGGVAAPVPIRAARAQHDGGDFEGGPAPRHVPRPARTCHGDRDDAAAHLRAAWRRCVVGRHGEGGRLLLGVVGAVEG